MRTEAVQDFFDENTAFFSGDFDPNVKGLNPFAAHVLAVDDPLSANLSWWQRWKVDDNDPNDDETIVAGLVDTMSSLSDAHADYLIKLCDGKLGYDDAPVI